MVTIDLSSASAVLGQRVVATATVHVAGSVAARAPTGSVTFSDGRVVLGKAPLKPGADGGIAALSVSKLGKGTHSLVASYGGDATYAPSGTQAPARLRVTQDHTATTIRLSKDSSAPGQPVVATATVRVLAPGSGRPTGNVIFGDRAAGTVVVTTVPLQGNAQATLALHPTAAGTHMIKAAYAGDGNDFSSSASAMLTVTAAGVGPEHGSGSAPAPPPARRVAVTTALPVPQETTGQSRVPALAPAGGTPATGSAASPLLNPSLSSGGSPDVTTMMVSGVGTDMLLLDAGSLGSLAPPPSDKLDLPAERDIVPGMQDLESLLQVQAQANLVPQPLDPVAPVVTLRPRDPGEPSGRTDEPEEPEDWARREAQLYLAHPLKDTVVGPLPGALPLPVPDDFVPAPVGPSEASSGPGGRGREASPPAAAAGPPAAEQGGGEAAEPGPAVRVFVALGALAVALLQPFGSRRGRRHGG